MCSNEHISKEQSAYSRTEHKCAKVGGDRHDGCTVVDDGSLKITQMYLLTMCLNMHRYESTSTGVRESCQGGCTLMCSNVLVSKQKSKRGLSGRVHSGWWWIPPPLSLSTVVPAGREWKPPCVLHNANTNTHRGKCRFRKVQKVIQMLHILPRFRMVVYFIQGVSNSEAEFHFTNTTTWGKIVLNQTNALWC